MQITRKSQFTGKLRTIDLPITIEQLQRWQNGAHIQVVMPHLTADEREFLITGITGDEWKDLFGDDEEPNEKIQEELDKHIHDQIQEQIGCENKTISDLEMREIDESYIEQELNKDRAIEDAQDWTPY